MTGLSVIENRISSIEKYLRILAGYKKFSRRKIEENTMLKGAVERYLYLAVQSAIDLSEAIISYKKLRKPVTMAEGFEILREEKIIPSALTGKLVSMVGFRNVIAHDYDEIDYDIVYEILQKGADDVKTFIKLVKRIY